METSDSMNLPVYEASPRGALAHSNRFRERLVIPATVSALLDEWARTTGHPHEEIVAPAEFRAASVVHGLEDPAGAWIRESLEGLVARFAEAFDLKRVKAFFGPIRGDQCRKFHVDYVRCRLVATFHGPGTEWLDEDNVDRGALVDSPACAETANRAIVRDPSRIHRGDAGDVLWLKGILDDPLGGCVHRSPPIEGKDTPRVVAILTTVEAKHARSSAGPGSPVRP